MKLTLDEMNAVNAVQIEIFRAFVEVCNNLNLRYYLVHGSLLGALRYGGPFPYDDDIDVAMPRKDYDKLVLEANACLPENLFLQSCETESEYPLQFAKMRDSNTAFIQSDFSGFSVNQGIYIDIFPIDFFPTGSFEQKIFRFVEGLYNARITNEMSLGENQPFWKTALRKLSTLFCPSLQNAIRKRAEVYARLAEGPNVITIGGKGTERGIPAEWFAEGKPVKFAGIDAMMPADSDRYLKCIYGDYMNYNPMGKYLNADGTVTVNATAISTVESYVDVLRRREE